MYWIGRDSSGGGKVELPARSTARSGRPHRRNAAGVTPLALRRERHLNACSLAEYGLGAGDDWRTVTIEKLHSLILMAEPDIVEEAKWRKASKTARHGRWRALRLGHRS